MSPKNTVVVNIIGGPGVGKTTVAAELFSLLKKDSYDVENVSEFAKELVWEGRFEAFKDRLYMHGEQNHRLLQMNGKLDYIITDSPLILTSVYNDFHLKDQFSESYHNMIHLMVKETWNLYNNITFYIVRDTDYQTVGRRENQDEAVIIDQKIHQYLDENEIPYQIVNLSTAAKTIYKKLKENEKNAEN